MKPSFGMSNKAVPVDDAKSPFARACAKKLVEALRQKGLLTRTPRLGLWTNDFVDMLGFVKEERIAKVLDWYCANLGIDYLPQAYSAGAFADKFLQIESRMDDDPANTIISPEAKESVKNLLNESPWPPKYEQVLPMVFQRSMDNYAPFFERMKILRDTLQRSTDNKDKQDSSLLNHLFVYGVITNPRHFVRYVWMRAVYRGARKGRMPVRSMIWNGGLELFHELGREEAFNFTGSWRRWDSLAERWKGHE